MRIRVGSEKRKSSTLHVYFPRSSQRQLDLVVELGRYANASKALQLLVEREFLRLRRKYPESC